MKKKQSRSVIRKIYRSLIDKPDWCDMKPLERLIEFIDTGMAVIGVVETLMMFVILLIWSEPLNAVYVLIGSFMTMGLMGAFIARALYEELVYEREIAEQIVGEQREEK